MYKYIEKYKTDNGKKQTIEKEHKSTAMNVERTEAAPPYQPPAVCSDCLRCTAYNGMVKGPCVTGLVFTSTDKLQCWLFRLWSENPCTPTARKDMDSTVVLQCKQYLIWMEKWGHGTWIHADVALFVTWREGFGGERLVQKDLKKKPALHCGIFVTTTQQDVRNYSTT